MVSSKWNLWSSIASQVLSRGISSFLVCKMGGKGYKIYSLCTEPGFRIEAVNMNDLEINECHIYYRTFNDSIFDHQWPGYVFEITHAQ